MTFHSVMELTRTISSSTAFEDEECMAYYNLLTCVPSPSTVIEIGLQFGRSSSIALQVAKERGLKYYGIDPFSDPPEAEAEWDAMRQSIGHPVWTFKCKSEDVPFWPEDMSIALIDGDHTSEGVRIDCDLILPRIMPGGYVCFHDYGRFSLPDIYPTVQAAMSKYPMFKEIMTAGTLGVFKRNA